MSDKTELVLAKMEAATDRKKKVLVLTGRNHDRYEWAKRKVVVLGEDREAVRKAMGFLSMKTLGVLNNRLELFDRDGTVYRGVWPGVRRIDEPDQCIVVTEDKGLRLESMALYTWKLFVGAHKSGRVPDEWFWQYLKL